MFRVFDTPISLNLVPRGQHLLGSALGQVKSRELKRLARYEKDVTWASGSTS